MKELRGNPKTTNDSSFSLLKYRSRIDVIFWVKRRMIYFQFSYKDLFSFAIRTQKMRRVFKSKMESKNLLRTPILSISDFNSNQITSCEIDPSCS